MILTSLPPRSRRAAPAARPGRPALAARLVAVLLLPLALAACSNSRLVVGPLYERLDDRMMSGFEELADFDASQRALFARSVDTFHLWHRRAELPAYAALLDEIAGSIATPGATTLADVTRWGDVVETRASAARECLPVNFSAPLTASLTDAQIDDIERHVAEEREEDRERYLSRTDEERLDRRARNARKWARRIGVELNAGQDAMLRAALEGQTSLGGAYGVLVDRWNATLFEILRDRRAPDREARLAAHLDARWTLVRSNRPDLWERNRTHWRGFAERLVASLTPGQRTAASAWLAKMADTLRAVARDEPSSVAGEDPSIGCLVDTAATDGAPGTSAASG